MANGGETLGEYVLTICSSWLPQHFEQIDKIKPAGAKRLTDGNHGSAEVSRGCMCFWIACARRYKLPIVGGLSALSGQSMKVMEV